MPEGLVLDPRRRRATVIGVIRSARRRLVLSIFRCNDTDVLDALADAVARGVAVSAIVTDRAKKSAQDLDRLRSWLIERGVDVRRYAPAVKYHAKYVVADRRTALVGSLNFTTSCFERTCDFLLVIRDADVVSALVELFDADWARRRPRLTPSQQRRVIVGPELRPRDRFAALVLGARRRIRIIDRRLTDPYMQWLLESRQAAGIEVDIMRRHDLRPLKSHGRLLIVDDSVAAIGSFALTAGALEKRRELAVVTSDPATLRALDAFWRAAAGARRPSQSPIAMARSAVTSTVTAAPTPIPIATFRPGFRPSRPGAIDTISE
jgi:phosphatidylserine/phosphatidylglycerophosphate/cardiolipin synthase-like enzyme